MERHPNDLTTDEEIDQSIVDAAAFDNSFPRIVSAVFHPEPDLDLFVVKLNDGRRLVLPREELSELNGATLEQAADFRVGRYGRDIWWPQVDDGIYLPNLLRERFGEAIASAAA